MPGHIYRMRRRRRQREDYSDWSRGPRRRWRPQSRGCGCLLWAVLLVIVLAVLATLFGGFQKGTKTGSLGFISGRAMVVCCIAENAGRL
jgi:hypothetical protein